MSPPPCLPLLIHGGPACHPWHGTTPCFAPAAAKRIASALAGWMMRCNRKAPMMRCTIRNCAMHKIDITQSLKDNKVLCCVAENASLIAFFALARRWASPHKEQAFQASSPKTFKARPSNRPGLLLCIFRSAPPLRGRGIVVASGSANCDRRPECPMWGGKLTYGAS